MKVGVDGLDLRRPLGVGHEPATGEVVGEAGAGEPLGTALHGQGHGRADPAHETAQHGLAVHDVAKGGRFGLEQGAETIGIHVVALELGPGVIQMVGGVDSPDQILGQPVGRLVGVERLEGAGRDHPTEIPQHSSNHGPILVRGLHPRPRQRPGTPSVVSGGHPALVLRATCTRRRSPISKPAGQTGGRPQGRRPR